MPPRGRRGTRRERGGGTPETRAAPSQQRPTVQERRSRRQQQEAGANQPGQQRVPEVVQVLTIHEDQPRNARNIAQQQRPQREPPARRNVARRGRGRLPRRGRSAPQVRAAVVCLDGVSPSESEGEQERPQTKEAPLQEEKREYTEDFHITLSPDKMCRGIMSDPSDSEDELRPSAAAPSSHTPVVRQPVRKLNSSPSGSSDEDIFDLDYAVCNTHALQEAFKEIKSTEVSQSPPPSGRSPSKPVQVIDSDDDCVIEEYSADTRKRQYSSDSPGSPPSSPVLFDIGRIVQSKNAAPRTRKKRNNISAAQSKRQLEKLSEQKKISTNVSLNLSCDLLISDGEDEEVNPEIRVLIKWGRKSFRMPIRKWQKFTYLYKALGEKYEVSADRVVLSLKDKIVNPEHTPGDLKLTIGDCIEGGIQSLQSSASNHQGVGRGGVGVLAASDDPDSILLRVQNSDRKGSVTVSLGLMDMMSVLMHKYAEEKQISIDKLQFWFDGEVLSPNSTPNSLDMEGGECIDVFMLT